MLNLDFQNPDVGCEMQLFFFLSLCISCGTNDTRALCLVVESKLSSTAERELWIFGGQGCISDLLFWPGSCWERQQLAQTALGAPALGGLEEDRRRRDQSCFCKTSPSGLHCTPPPPHLPPPPPKWKSQQIAFEPNILLKFDSLLRYSDLFAYFHHHIESKVRRELSLHLL